MLELIKSFIDKIFKPPIAMLDLAIEKLSDIYNITARGINVNHYLFIFGDLPQRWQWVITSLFSSLVLLVTLIMIRASMRLYYASKEGVKWW